MLRLMPAAYLTLCAAALFVFALGTPWWAGEDADPLSAVFAYVLALPWIRLLDLVEGETPVALAVAAMIAGMALNWWLLRLLVRRLTRRRGAIR